MRIRLADRPAGAALDEPTITVSAGCAAISRGSTVDAFLPLLNATDVALGQAKRSGRNRVVCAEV